MTSIISHPSARYGKGLARDISGIVQFYQHQFDEIAVALAVDNSRSVPLESFCKSDFPLPTLPAHLRIRQQDVSDSRGFSISASITSAAKLPSAAQSGYGGRQQVELVMQASD